MARKKKTPEPITTQDNLPGVPNDKIEVIETLAKNLAEVRGERIRQGREEADLQGRLVEEMKKAKLTYYECKTFIAKVKLKHGADKVSVKAKMEDDGDDE